MPILKERCDCCGHWTTKCPDCGGNHVTPREDLYVKDPREIIDHGLKLQDPPYTVKYTHVCWDCGWTETVKMTIEREVEHGT